MMIQNWLRLALAPEVGPVLAHRLLEAFGSPEAIFSASRTGLMEVKGLGQGRLERLMDPIALRLARDEQDLATEAGVRLLCPADDEYPDLLRRMGVCPLVLWVRGRLDPVDRLALAIVGPRSPSQYGRLMAGALSAPLAAKGLTLVSGLAYGIDGEAHRGALEAGGRTIAVVGQGLGTSLYPHTNASLTERIIGEDRGAIVSIFPMLSEPAAGLFPQRNEIIAGLSLATLVIEASSKSGALITARHAVRLGRLVMACPGDANRRNAQGSNRLLADGALLIQKADDVLADMGQELRREMEFLAESGATAMGGEDASGHGCACDEAGGDDGGLRPGAMPCPANDALTDAVLDLLSEQPFPADILLERLSERQYAPAAILDRLLTLELEGRLRQLPGRLYARHDA